MGYLDITLEGLSKHMTRNDEHITRWGGCMRTGGLGGNTSRPGFHEAASKATMRYL